MNESSLIWPAKYEVISESAIPPLPPLYFFMFLIKFFVMLLILSSGNKK